MSIQLAASGHQVLKIRGYPREGGPFVVGVTVGDEFVMSEAHLRR
jgi:hypothetical protein